MPEVTNINFENLTAAQFTHSHRILALTFSNLIQRRKPLEFSFAYMNLIDSYSILVQVRISGI